MTGGKISAIILAAGFSSRMGHFKPLLPLGDGPILQRVITLFQKAGIKDIHVVVGHGHTELKPVVENLKARPVFNPDYRKGMFSSVIAGLTALNPATEAFFLLPVDIPLVKSSTILVLLDAYQANKNHLIYPTFEGSRGHPPLIPFIYVKDIINWNGQEGLNGALKHIADHVLEIGVPDENILFDIDTPEDYQRLLLKWHKADDRA